MKGLIMKLAAEIFFIIYMIMGIVTVVILRQTPYQDNPLWAKFLLWPLYWWQGL